MTSPLLVF